ncbi:tetratricopeptide repeat protein [Streptomyces kanamyceticus]|uniref:Tetratricopeptide repeat protein n=1 Tax=Streptomyces kanamyceticus TaxID=1967 RepID=A0A5J6GNU0_STRKN|nr:tetratricopeptide repeat protein [Streptomyces kanamyceticus]
MVGLAVTEAWTQARTRLTRLFSRRSQNADTDDADTDDVEQLRSAIEQLAGSLQSGSTHDVGDSADQLRRRLRHSLRQGSETARELVDLLSHMGDMGDTGDMGSTSTSTSSSSSSSSSSSNSNSNSNSPISYHVPEALRRQGPPSQVPALRHHFINRSDELAVLDGQFDRDTDSSYVDVRVLAGPPGVGKSALAHYWAHSRRTRERFSDGRLYVDFAAAGADVTEAVGHCLRSLGVADALLPPSLGERTALFRDRTADLRVLLVLDDVSSPAQVRALIPNGPGSAVLATSTGKLGELTLDGARPLPLEPLTEAAGLLLLADRCGQERVAADPEAAERVVGLCAGLPVALQVAAARLVNEPRLTLDALATELTDDEGRLSALSVGGESPVAAVLDSAYRQLSADMAHGYRLLGWIPGPTFDAATAAAAVGRDLESAQVLLDVLEDMSLLELTEERRYRFHGLVRLHARDRARVEERFGTGLAVTERVLTHYLILTALADRSVRADRLRVAELRTVPAGRPDPFAAPNGPRPLDWLAAERANIMAVLRAADDPSLHAPGWQLAECFTVLFLHHRHLGDWQESLELGARYAAAAVAPAAEARLRSLLSRPLMDTGEHERAHRELTTALTCAEIADDPVLHASVLEFSGRYWDRFDPDRAVAAYRRSMELNAQGREPRGAAIAAFFLGRAQDARGDHDQAIGTLRRARADLLALPTPDHRMAARATAALGRALDNLGRTGEAVPTLREAARTLERLEGHAYEAEALLDLVAIAERPGADRSTLRDDLTRAITIHADMGSPLTESLRERLRRSAD